MVIMSDAVAQSTATHYVALLHALNEALSGHGVRGRVVRVIRLRLRFDEFASPGYVPPELEIRGADHRLRATVTVIPGHSELAFCVRPVPEGLRFLFPVAESGEAVAFLVGAARDWSVP
jgi:hypothetical protein